MESTRSIDVVAPSPALTPESDDATPSAVAEGQQGQSWPPLAVGQWASLLHCQSQLLHRITSRSSPKHIFSPIFELADRQLGCCANGVELKSSNSELVHHLAQKAVPQEILRHGKLRLLEEGASIGALAMAQRCPVVIADIAADPAPISDDLRQTLLDGGIKATWAVPVFDEAGAAAGALTLYFDAVRTATSQDSQLLEWLGNLTYHMIVFSRSREAKKISDERFAVLVESIPGVVYQRAVTPDGQIKYTYISNAAEDLFGVTPEEILTDPNALFDCHGEGYRENFRERLLKASRELRIWDVEATIVTRKGERKFTHAIAKPIEQQDGTVIWNGVILDATRIKDAEMRAAAAEAHTRQAIVENLNQGFVLFDSDGRLVIANSKLKSYYPQLAGYFVPGTTLGDFLEAERSNGLVADSGNDPAALENEATQKGEERCLPDGTWLMVQQHRAVGEETVILYTEISKLKKREEALAKSNRELQDFASIASHDLQEPLRKIEAFGDRLRSRCADDLGEQGGFYLERMQNAAGRMRTLINDLLTYSRVTTKARPFAECNLNIVVGEVISDLQLQIDEAGADVRVDSLPTIDADALQMRQLFQNMLSNTIKYRDPERPLVVKIEGTVPENDPRRVCEIRVSDNGVGFEMAYADRIFAIFQRLHNHQDVPGTGIGLATVRKIVDRHYGTIRAESVPGEGSTFITTLPVRQARKTEGNSNASG